jgi:hypothetical protein
MSEEEAKNLALDIACIYPESYMPEDGNMNNFEPHLWVIRAIQVAYEKGRADG